MSKVIRTLSFLIFYFSATVNAQTFQWYRTVESEGFDEAYDLAADNQGNVYVAGMIEYDADFGNGVILSSAGVHDIFIAKYDSTGNLIWARRAGGADGDKVQSITLDGQGYLYVAGEFEVTSYWDTIVKVAAGGNNVFVARYDTSGNVQWVRTLGTVSPYHTRGYGVTADSQSNVYVAGGTMGDTYYENNFLFTSAGDYDGTLFSFDKFGNFRWAKRMGGSDSDKARGVVCDQSNNVYVTGYFSGTADFSGTSLSSHGHTDIFLAKYDMNGMLQWATQAGDTGFERSWDVDINVNGQILIAGDESRGTFDTHVASCQGMTDAFVAGYDASGNNLWVVAGGGPEADEGRGVSHDNSGNVYLIGDYGGSASFPPVSYIGGHYAEPFIASYTPDGSVLRWVRNGLGPSNDRGTGIGLDPSGNIFVCGNFDISLQLGSFALTGDSLLDIYVTRLSARNICSSSAAISGTISCAGLCNGTATVNAFGQSPFTYSWNSVPVQTTQTASGLCAGSYTVTVTDFNGCASTAGITLIDPPQLSVTSATTSITCNGSCDGTATATAAGQSPFTYSWNTVPVQTTETATTLCEGNYTVTVTDVAGCTETSSVTLVDPPQLIVNSSTTNISCYGSCDGTASATAAGQSPFTYSWNSIPVQTNEIATSLCAGNYIVTVTDVAGCTETSSVTLVDPAAMTVGGTLTNTTCTGCTDGSIDITASGGTGAYQYLWSNGSTAEDLQSIMAGIYSVCVTDTNQCSVCDTFTILDPATGIAIHNDDLHFSLFPNPASEFTTIRLDETFTAGAEVELYNSLGELIDKNVFFSSQFVFQTSELINGVYFLSVKNKRTNSRGIIPLVINSQKGN